MKELHNQLSLDFKIILASNTDAGKDPLRSLNLIRPKKKFLELVSSSTKESQKSEMHTPF